VKTTNLRKALGLEGGSVRQGCEIELLLYGRSEKIEGRNPKLDSDLLLFGKLMSGNVLGLASVEAEDVQHACVVVRDK